MSWGFIGECRERKSDEIGPNHSKDMGLLTFNYVTVKKNATNQLLIYNLVFIVLFGNMAEFTSYIVTFFIFTLLFMGGFTSYIVTFKIHYSSVK